MKNRYAPQIRLEEIGESGQERLALSKVLIVGCGALGSPVAMYLAGAGIGHIMVADFDTVDRSNLHRQVFYSEMEVGKGKAETLASKMRGLNTGIYITAASSLITKKWLQEKISPEVTYQEESKDEPKELKFDVIVDAADNPSTTYLIDEFCKNNSIPMVTAGVTGWTAQIFTFIPGSFSYSDIFPQPSEELGILPCSIAGIAGPTAAFAAAIQSSAVLKILLGLTAEKSQLITANLLHDEFKVLY